VQEFNEDAKRDGVRGVEYQPDGSVKITSRQGRKQLMKLRGLKDNQGSYGD
jgi:hypothetical protein